MTIRHAVIEGYGHDKIETIRRYMPSNYTANTDGESIFIQGTDNAGWTLDGYVIPRLASGLYFAKEVEVKVSDTVLAEAEAAYDREDYDWFYSLSTETLAIMWALCCDIATCPAWDDEVFDALGARGYFKD